MKLFPLILLLFLFSVSASAQQTFTDDFNGLTYTYPEDWNKDQNSTGNYYVTNDTAYFIAQVNLFFKDFTFNAENINDSAYRKDLLDKMAFTTGREASIRDYGNMLVSGLPAYFILFDVSGKGNDPKTGSRILQVQTGDDEKLYTFNAGAPHTFYSQYKYIFDSIIASVKIK